MKKSIPLIRIIRLLHFIKKNNNKQIIIDKKHIINYISNLYPDNEYNDQLFDRDKRKIREELNIDLKYTSDQGYFIDSTENYNLLENSLDYFEMFSVLNEANTLPDMFLISKRKPLGLNQIGHVVSYIREQMVIQFQYQKYDTSTYEIRQVEPLAIKESRERWYLIANDFAKDNGLRAFAFDRISEVTITGKKFAPKYSLNEIKAKYNSLFAMFDDEAKEAEDIILQFDQRDGNYIKSFPIHHSQQIKQIKNGVEVSLKLKTTPDFIMEIMSRAWSLKVIQPESLRLEIIHILKDSIERNQ